MTALWPGLSVESDDMETTVPFASEQSGGEIETQYQFHPD
jgi:hypothetical protein